MSSSNGGEAVTRHLGFLAQPDRRAKALEQIRSMNGAAMRGEWNNALGAALKVQAWLEGSTGRMDREQLKKAAVMADRARAAIAADAR